MDKALAHQAQVVKKMNPGRPGTLKHLQKWGESLVCVRHRHDHQSGEKLTTVEIVVDRMKIQRHPVSTVKIQIPPFDQASRHVLLAAGGRWNPKTKKWTVPAKVAEALKLFPNDHASVGLKK